MFILLNGILGLSQHDEVHIEYNSNGEVVGIVVKLSDGTYKRYKVTPKSGDTTVSDRETIENDGILQSYPWLKGG